jgi:hypothetical protein
MPTHPRHSDTELPPDGFVDRWTASRKEAVVSRVVAGELSPGDALRRWNISVEELDAWLMAYRRRGRRGLHAQVVPPAQERLL